jgi:hypothetical protein
LSRRDIPVSRPFSEFSISSASDQFADGRHTALHDPPSESMIAH